MNTSRTDWHFRCGAAFRRIRRIFPSVRMAPLMCMRDNIVPIGLTIPQSLKLQAQNDNLPQRH